jgi:hypothetical protein
LQFLQHLVSLNLSRKTIRKHADNLWILGFSEKSVLAITEKRRNLDARPTGASSGR